MLGDWQLSPICIASLECGIWVSLIPDLGMGERSTKESEVQKGLCVNTPSPFSLCFLNRPEETSNVFKILYLK